MRRRAEEIVEPVPLAEGYSYAELRSLALPTFAATDCRRHIWFNPARRRSGTRSRTNLYISMRMSPKPPLQLTNSQGQTTLPASADSRGPTS